MSQLAQEYNAITAAVHVDGKDAQLIRFCFAKDDATLIEAAKRLEKLRQ